MGASSAANNSRRVTGVLKALIGKIRTIPQSGSAEDEVNALRASQRPLRVAFINAHAVNLCFKEPGFLTDLTACDFIYRDGVGMKLLYKLCGLEPGLNMNGTDLIPLILQAYRGRRVALLGTSEPYLSRAVRRVSELGLDPYLVRDGFAADEDYIDAIRSDPPPLVILAMGMPKQERVAARLVEVVTGPCVIVCGGAILDFLAGKVTRAPGLLRDLGLEWAHRLALEPRRLIGRYLIGNAVFILRAGYYAPLVKRASKT